MARGTIFLGAICLSIYFVRSLQQGVCKEDINGVCQCFEEVISEKEAYPDVLRRDPVRCRSPCELYPRCDTEKNKVIYNWNDRTCPGVTIVSRQQWSAKKPKGPVGVINHPVAQFYIHQTETPGCYDFESCKKRLLSIQEYHFSLGWSDIAYSFLAGGDGKIYEGRGWGKVGSHTEGYNDMSYAASFIGNFTSKLPKTDSMTAVKNLISCGINLANITQLYSLYGHRDACGDTDCPGNALYKEIHQWKNYKRVPNPSAACVAKGRRCKKDKSTCKPGSLLNDTTLCKGPNKFCCLKPPKLHTTRQHMDRHID